MFNGDDDEKEPVLLKAPSVIDTVAKKKRGRPTLAAVTNANLERPVFADDAISEDDYNNNIGSDSDDLDENEVEARQNYRNPRVGAAERKLLADMAKRIWSGADRDKFSLGFPSYFRCKKVRRRITKEEEKEGERLGLYCLSDGVGALAVEAAMEYEKRKAKTKAETADHERGMDVDSSKE